MTLARWSATTAAMIKPPAARVTQADAHGAVYAEAHHDARRDERSQHVTGGAQANVTPNISGFSP